MARNIKGYPFPTKLGEKQALKLRAEVKEAVTGSSGYMAQNYEYLQLMELTDQQLLELVERHTISRNAVINREHGAVLRNADDSDSVMIIEEDHLRIQSICPGNDIDKAWENANNIDNLISEKLHYAFDTEWGFLTSCPTNTGTGLRASYMLHLPALELLGLMKSINTSISKLGYTIRGAHGEGTEALGSIYQLSNQTTLGKSENESISGLKSLATQIVCKEEETRNEMMVKYPVDMEDKFCRATAILKNCRKITLEEALELLSQLRLCQMIGEEMENEQSIYSLMLDVQPGSLALFFGDRYSKDNEEELRAEYLRERL